MKVGIFYGSTTGVTKDISKKIAEKIGGEVYTANEIEKMLDMDLTILATSTWGAGDLQDDWLGAIDNLKKLNIQGKKVALVGVGDQIMFSSTFVNGLKELYDIVKEQGANIVGDTSIEGYEYDDSTAIVDGRFVGLVVDETNQSELTDERIENWLREIQ